MVVLGIDPGTANTGYGVVARHGARLVALDGGVIETAAGEDPGERLVTIFTRVCAMLDEYRPDALAVEDLYFGANARSAFAVGQARGVVILAAGQRGLPCRSYTPQQVKGAVCGSGRADKRQVQRMVQTLLALADLPRPDHAADALAVAICHANGAPLRAAQKAAVA
jgi:crossover junction endodeoxyribonuclease RuvC